MTNEALRESLDRALAPDAEDDYDPVAVKPQTLCTAEGCENPATEWKRVPSGVEGADERSVDAWMSVARCATHGDERFRIDNDGKANWGLHKLREERRKLNEIDTMYQAELERLNAWRDTQRGPHERREQFFMQHLIVYGYMQRAQDPAGKERSSIPLPGGTIKFTRSTAVEITDETALIEWAETNGYEVLVTKSVGKQDVTGILLRDKTKGLQETTVDGEKVPGIHVDRRLNPSVVINV